MSQCVEAKAATPFTLSVSVGAVVHDAKSDVTLQALLTQADALMYERKRARHRDSLRN